MSYTIQNSGSFVETVSGTGHTASVTLSANAGRRLLVAVMKEVSDATATLNALTFNGTSFYANSRLKFTHSLNASMVGELFDYAIPDNLGAGSYNLVATTSGSTAATTMYWREVTGLSTAAPYDTGSAETEAATLACSASVDAEDGGLILAFNLNASGTPTHSWSGAVTERQENNETGYTTSAADGTASGTGAKTCTSTQSGADGRQIVVAVSYSITSGPTINTQPTAQTARVNGDPTNTATFTVAATTSGGSLTYDWELETSVGGGSYSNLADGNGATWTGQAAASCVGTFTAKTLSGRRVRCNVTDSNGTTTTDAVTLTVLDGPVLSASTATTNGSGVCTVTMTSDDALTTNGEILLVTASIGGTVVARTVVRPA